MSRPESTQSLDLRFFPSRSWSVLSAALALLLTASAAQAQTPQGTRAAMATQNAAPTVLVTNGDGSSNPLNANGPITRPSPLTNTFSTTAVGSTAQQSFTFNFNFSSATTLTGGGAYTQGNGDSDFQDVGGTCDANGYPFTYAANTSCTMTVIFMPTRPGNRQGAAVLYTGTQGTYYYGAVNGIATAPQVSLTRSTPTITNVSSGGSPYNSAVDGFGNLWVTDSAAGTVKKFALANGVYPSSPTQTFTGFTSPQGIAIDGAGTVYVGDGAKGYVWRLLAVNGAIPDGTPPSAYVSFLSAGSQPVLVQIDPTYTYVYFTGVLNGSNYLLYCILASGTCGATTTFTSPVGLAVDAAGYKYIAEAAGTVVQLPVAYNSTTKTTLLSGLSSPTGMAFDAAGDLYIATKGNGASGSGAVTQYIATNGAVSSSSVARVLANNLYAPAGVTVDSSGNVIIADTSNSALRYIDVVDPPSFAFGTLPIGSTSTAAPLTLQNTGNATLSFLPPSSGQNPSLPSGYSLASGWSCPIVTPSASAGTLAAGATCSGRIAFSPVTGGPDNGSLIFTDNNLNAYSGPGSTQSIALTGDAPYPPPTANNQSVSVNFNTSTPVTLSASGGGTLSYSIVSQPTRGTLSGTAPNLTYTPNANYQGSDSFLFRAGNSSGSSNAATVSITVLPGTPSANSQSVSTSFNTAKSITLTGTDPDNPPLPLTYSIVSAPSHGTLSGTAPNLTYTPTANYNGSDSFFFRVSNGNNTSTTGVVNITVVPGYPTANSQSVSTAFNTAKAITLSATDPDVPVLPLTYSVISSPAHGTLSGTAPNLTYTPVANYYGADSFTFRASNGTASSSVATVSIAVQPGTPTANSQVVSTPLNASAAILLTGSDPDSPPLPLTYTVLSAPAHGTLTGTAPNLTYTPSSNFVGTDNFNFRTSNGTNSSNPATVSITVTDSFASLQLSGIPNTVYPGVAQSLTVRAVGLSGGTFNGFTGTVTLTSTDPAAVLSPATYTFTPADAGVHTFQVTFATAGTYSVTAKSGSVSASVTTQVGNYIWTVSNTGAVTRGTEAGSSLASSGGGQPPALFGGMAFDNAGNSYSVVTSSNAVTRASSTNIPAAPLTGGGLTAPSAIAVDGAGFVWVTNLGNSSLSIFDASGTAVSNTNGVAPASVTTPSSLAIDNTGGIWVTNKSANTVTHLFGAAQPVVTPLANAAGNAQIGVKP